MFRRGGTWLAGAAAAALAAAVLLVLRSNRPDVAMPPASANAAYEKALHLIDRRTSEALRLAGAYLTDAARLDPASADVQAALAKVARLEGEFNAAEDRARLALSLEPNHAAAHLETGIVLAMRDWDWTQAERHVRRAITEDPANAAAHAAHAAIPTVLGRHEEALEASRRAYDADPLSALVRVDHGWFHYYAGDYDTAWRVCGEAALAGDAAAAIPCQYKAAAMSRDETRALDAAARLAARWREDEPAARTELGRDLAGLEEFRLARQLRIERLRRAAKRRPKPSSRRARKSATCRPRWRCSRSPSRDVRPACRSCCATRSSRLCATSPAFAGSYAVPFRRATGAGDVPRPGNAAAARAGPGSQAAAVNDPG